MANSPVSIPFQFAGRDVSPHERNDKPDISQPFEAKDPTTWDEKVHENLKPHNEREEATNSISDDAPKGGLSKDDPMEQSSDEDPLAGVDGPIGYDQGKNCELHTYELRYTSKGELVILQVGSKAEITDEEERSPNSALVLTREYSQITKQLLSVKLEIKSPYIKSALREVVKSYPDVSFDTIGPIVINKEPRCIFHYRHELKAYAEGIESAIAKQHVEFLLKYMARALRKEIRGYDKLMGSRSSPGIEFQNLWMAFRPGDLLYQRKDGRHIISRLRQMETIKIEISNQHMHQYWWVRTTTVEYDGEDFLYSSHGIKIEHYDGYKPLKDLVIFPLQYLQGRKEIIASVRSRGEKYMAFVGVQIRHYQGKAEMILGEGKQREVRAINSRIVIDCKEFYTNHAYEEIIDISGKKAWSPETKDGTKLSADDILLCSDRIPAFCLASKQWCLFDVSKIEDVDFNDTAFDKLLLPKLQKHLIHSLIKEHQEKSSGFDDIIKGKGKGLIFLLHGEPGVGKTLTAESIAEFSKRPLYTIGCADLGMETRRAEDELTRILNLATKWNAVVLIDEADVFMEQRSNNELQRNGLVSLLLRTLEYFEGVMFLTTNRVDAIDTAFKSRIHLAITYPSLGLDSRRIIWDQFLRRSTVDHSKPDWLDEKFLQRVAGHKLNGRQVKNIIRLGCSLAANDNRSLAPEDILIGLEALESFEIDFTEAKLAKKKDGWLSKFRVLSMRNVNSEYQRIASLSGLIFLAVALVFGSILKMNGVGIVLEDLIKHLL